MILKKKAVHLARGCGGYSSICLLLGPQPQLLPTRFKLFLAVEKEYGGSTDDTAALTGRHIPNLHLFTNTKEQGSKLKRQYYKIPMPQER
jgi:hypothetical protein